MQDAGATLAQAQKAVAVALREYIPAATAAAKAEQNRDKATQGATTSTQQATAVTAATSQEISQLTSIIGSLVGAVETASGAIQENTEAMQNASQSVEENDRASSRAADNGLDKLLKKVLSLATAYKVLRSAAKYVSDAMDTSAYTAQLQALMGDSVGKQASDWAKQAALSYGRAYSDVLDSTLNLTKLGANGNAIEALSGLSNRLALFTVDNDYGAVSDAITNAFKTGRTASLATALGMAQSTLEAYGVDKAIEAADIDAYVDALNRATAAAGMTEEAAAKLADTSKNQFATLKSNLLNMLTTVADSFLTTFTPAMQRMNEWFQTEQATQFFSVLSAGFSLVGQVASIFMNAHDSCKLGWRELGSGHDCGGSCDWLVGGLLAFGGGISSNHKTLMPKPFLHLFHGCAVL